MAKKSTAVLTFDGDRERRTILFGGKHYEMLDRDELDLIQERRAINKMKAAASVLTNEESSDEDLGCAIADLKELYEQIMVSSHPPALSDMQMLRVVQAFFTATPEASAAPAKSES